MAQKLSTDWRILSLACRHFLVSDATCVLETGLIIMANVTGFPKNWGPGTKARKTAEPEVLKCWC
ncbi:hypothetical protein E2320_014661 [Naja naja]|nr:hypothetical protein E2320_014661 [Naja naja]